MDKEKVIKGLEHCIRESEHIDDNPCDGCPYFVSDQYGCERTQMEKDALALLKEQEALRWHNTGFFLCRRGTEMTLLVNRR